MAEAPIPTYSNLKDVYAEGSITVDQLQSLPNMHPPGDQEAHNRIVALHDAFVKRFGSKPDVLARSPGTGYQLVTTNSSTRLGTGRVNIIGEHIDYEGYGVLPMAIAQVLYLVAWPSNTQPIVVRTGHSGRHTQGWGRPHHHQPTC